tara:strand:- start:151 stop:753 length:603 start_codon:yes stop_codon:yes gene_type:complete
MAEHDYVIANGTGAAVRADINSALAAIASNNSKATDPSSTFSYQWYVDTGDNTLYIRNAANNAWVAVSAVGGIGSANLGLAPAASPTITGDANFSGTGAVKIPVGTTGQRPGSPSTGQFRWNSTTGSAEIYDGSAFSAVGGGGGATGGDNGDNAVFWENQQAVTHDYSITAARNAGSFGPVTINASKTVTIPSGCIWTIV